MKRTDCAEGRRSFSAELASAGAARRFVSGTLGPTGADTSDVLIVASELAANAVVHARGSFEVRVQQADERRVRIEVVNDAPEMLAAMRTPSTESGRGLHIVESIASAWGTESRGTTKVVWAEIDLPPSAFRGTTSP